VAAGPEGAKVIEHFALADGRRSTSTFASGSFNKWFVDGVHFFSNTSTTVWVYTSQGAQVGIFALPTIENLTGQGSYFWTHAAHTPGYPLTIYALTGGGTAAASYALHVLEKVVPSGATTLGILSYGVGSVDVVELGPTIVRTTHAIPDIAYLGSFASDGTNFCVGNRQGVVLDSQHLSSPAGARSLSFGQVRSVSGSPSGMAAAALANGTIAIFDAGMVRALQAFAPFSSSDVDVAGDGAFLIAMANTTDSQYATDRSLAQFSLPDGELVRTWPGALATPPYPTSITLAQAASVLGTVSWKESYTYERRVTNLADDALLWSDTTTVDGCCVPGVTPAAIRISPDGTRIAVSDGYKVQGTTTRIYVNATLTGAGEGWAVGWVDDARLLANRYATTATSHDFAGAVWLDAQGQSQSSALPELAAVVSLSPAEVFDPYRNAIFDTETGAKVWASTHAPPRLYEDPPPLAAIAGDFVVYASGRAIFAERWR
jgi:hypothetical protein